MTRLSPRPHVLFLIALFVTLSTICRDAQATERPWEALVNQARGTTVDWYMWGGSPAVNSYVNGYVAKEMKSRYDITVRQVPVQDIGEIVSKLAVEKEAGKNTGGSADLIWINGENFRTCKEHGLLYGPFADQLPNSRYVDWNNPTVKSDFGTPVEAMESPWGGAQIVMIYDEGRTREIPASIPALLEWIKAHPGRFTYPAPPDFTGSAFLRHIFYHVSGSAARWQKPYSEEEFARSATATYQLLNELKPYLWRDGATYPDSPVRLNNLFVDGEIDFSFSYSQGEASRNIHDGLFPESVRTYVFEEGTIANTHFVAIPYNAGDKEAAMVLADFLLSPEAQLHKAAPEVWGDFPAISPARLDIEWQRAFAQRPKGAATLPDDLLQRHQLPEPPSDILVRLEKGWQQHVLKGR